jgi:hypothetical protein
MRVFLFSISAICRVAPGFMGGGSGAKERNCECDGGRTECPSRLDQSNHHASAEVTELT